MKQKTFMRQSIPENGNTKPHNDGNDDDDEDGDDNSTLRAGSCLCTLVYLALHL